MTDTPTKCTYNWLYKESFREKLLLICTLWQWEDPTGGGERCSVQRLFEVLGLLQKYVYSHNSRPKCFLQVSFIKLNCVKMQFIQSYQNQIDTIFHEFHRYWAKNFFSKKTNYQQVFLLFLSLTWMFAFAYLLFDG